MSNDPAPVLITPYCTLAWANTFFSQYGFSDNWTASSNEKKLSALNVATDFINEYCVFFDDKGQKKTYTPDGTDDYENDVIPFTLKKATAQEAVYLLSLDDNPAEPNPITILGLIKGSFGEVDPSLIPPIMTAHVRNLLESMNGEVDSSALGANVVGCFTKRIS